jgi:hypothetical protein
MSVTPSRFMNQDSDFEKFEVEKGIIQEWENATRTTEANKVVEWWYFDVNLEDGGQIVILFFRNNPQNFYSPTLKPGVEFTYTDAKGNEKHEIYYYPLDQCVFSEHKQNIKIGPHRFKGNLKEFTIEISPEGSFGLDISITNLAKSWRPDSGYLGFGTQDEKYYTWLCVAPKVEVSGTFSFKDVKREIKGIGYHDHQWMNESIFELWNHWFWSRQTFADGSTALLFDLVSSKEYAGKRFFMFFLQDKDGNIIFETTQNEVGFEILEEAMDPESDKMTPSKIKYSIEKDGDVLEYIIEQKKTIETKNLWKDTGVLPFLFFKVKGVKPNYMRYLSEATLKLTKDGIEKDFGKEEMIHELLYAGYGLDV